MRFALLALVAACGNGSSARTKSDAPPTDTPHIGDAPADAKVFMDAPPDAKIFMDAHVPDAKIFLDAPAGTYPLKVKNYQFWCAVEVNNSGTFSTALEQDVNVLPGVIPLVAKPASSTFKLGTDMWHHVDGTSGDTGISGTQAGTGVNATSTTSITIVASGACVWVCCPFSADGSGCDPAVIGDQCP